ncbi:Phenylalanine/histidine ammonia-lyase, partial [mine drainage metagenome]
MVELDGHRLTLDDVLSVARKGDSATLASSAAAAVAESRVVVERAMAKGQAVYGVTTGFGHLASVTIAPEERAQLQENLIKNHAAGVGPELPQDVVRAMLLLRTNALAK